MKKMRILWLVISCLFIAGCQTRGTTPSSYEINPPYMTKKVPLRVTLYLSSQFKNKTFIGNSGGMAMPISIGEAMSSGAEKALKKVFQEVMVVNDLSYNLSSIKNHAYVTPEIVDIGNVLTGIPPFSKWDSRIACKWVIKTPEEKILYVNTIVGEGKYEAVTTGFTFGDHLGKSMIPAIQDHYEKLVENLISTRWWDAFK